MRYVLHYQLMPMDSMRPVDVGHAVSMKAEKADVAFLPSRGDHVSVDRSPTGGEAIRGVVRSRLFTYTGASRDEVCNIYIVIEEAGGDWRVLAAPVEVHRSTADGKSAPNAVGALDGASIENEDGD